MSNRERQEDADSCELEQYEKDRRLPIMDKDKVIEKLNKMEAAIRVFRKDVEQNREGYFLHIEYLEFMLARIKEETESK